MNKLTILRAAVAVSMLAGAVVAAQAQARNWGSHVYSFADCDPSSSGAGQGPSSTNSCSSDEASARADTSFTSMKASVRVNAAAPAGDYLAGNIIQDALRATATDSTLAGTAGVVRFSVAFDGQMSTQTDLYFVAQHAVADPVYGSTNLTNLPVTSNLSGTPETAIVLRYRSWGDTSIDAVASWELPVVFGELATYQIGWSINAYAPNAAADFSHTWTLVGLDAFDTQGQPVAAAFSASSGAVLPTSPVPEPQSLLLLLAGLGLLAGRLRRA